MKYTRLWIIALILAGIIFIWFLISAPHTHDVAMPQTEATTTESAPVVTMRDSFRRGVHTITGSIIAPTPCTSLTATSTLLGMATSTASSTTPRIEVDITMPSDTGVCLQEPASLPFSTSITAPSDAVIGVFVNGIAASTTAP